MSEPIHVTDATFDTAVLKNSHPVIVDFWAPWCGPCKMIAPILEKLGREFDGKLIIAKVNTDETPDWAQKYQVQGIPTLLFMHNGKLIHKQVGMVPERVLREAVVQFIEVATGKA